MAVETRLKELLALRSAFRRLEERLWSTPTLVEPLHRLSDASHEYAMLVYAGSGRGVNVTGHRHSSLDALNDEVISSELDRASARRLAGRLNSKLSGDDFVLLRSAVESCDWVVLNALRAIHGVDEVVDKKVELSIDAAIHQLRAKPTFRLVQKMNSSQDYETDALQLIELAIKKLEAKRHGYSC